MFKTSSFDKSHGYVLQDKYFSSPRIFEDDVENCSYTHSCIRYFVHLPGRFLTKGHEIQCILQEALALPSALMQSLTKQQLDLPSSTLLRTANSECRHTKGFTTHVSQDKRLLAELSSKRKDRNRRFDGRCAKKHNPSI